MATLSCGDRRRHRRTELGWRSMEPDHPGVHAVRLVQSCHSEDTMEPSPAYALMNPIISLRTSRSPTRQGVQRPTSCGGSRSTSSRASSSRSWGRRAPANPRCSTSSGMHDAAWTGEYYLHGEPIHPLGKQRTRRAAEEAHRLRVPELPPARPPHGLREPRHAALLPRREEEGARQHWSATCSTGSRSSGRRTSTRRSSPAASSSWSASRAR